MNAVEIEAAISDLALEPFDAAEFPYAFLAAFGNKETALRRLRATGGQSNVPGGLVQRKQHPHGRLHDRYGWGWPHAPGR